MNKVIVLNLFFMLNVVWLFSANFGLVFYKKINIIFPICFFVEFIFLVRVSKFSWLSIRWKYYPRFVRNWNQAANWSTGKKKLFFLNSNWFITIVIFLSYPKLPHWILGNSSYCKTQSKLYFFLCIHNYCRNTKGDHLPLVEIRHVGHVTAA